MKFSNVHIFFIGVIVLLMAGLLSCRGPEGFQFTRVGGGREGFESRVCSGCNKPMPRCNCPKRDDNDDADKSDTPDKKICKGCYKQKSNCNCPGRGGSWNSGGSASGTGDSGSGGRGSGGSASGSGGSWNSGGSGSGGSASGSGGSWNSGNAAPIAPCPRTIEPDLSKYILKSQVPALNNIVPDMSNYMLKTECPAVPDLSKYILKSSIPKPQPVIIDNSSCKKDAGECPPCPRPRCPEVKCPPPTKCPPPAPCPRPVCPPTVVKCKSEEANAGSTVRPFLAPLNMSGFGLA